MSDSLAAADGTNSTSAITFGRIRQVIRSAEVITERINDARKDITGPLVAGSRGASYSIHVNNLTSERGAIMKGLSHRLGVGHIRAICEAATGQFDSQTLRQIRGRLCRALEIETHEADAMTAELFSDHWRNAIEGMGAGRDQHDDEFREISTTDGRHLQANADDGAKGTKQTVPTSKGQQTTTRRKPSTSSGDACTKLVAALTEHHQYEKGSWLNVEPIGVRALARKSDVSEGSASNFFKTHWGSHAKYKVDCRRPDKLAYGIKLLRGEVPPSTLSQPLRSEPESAESDE